MSVAEILHRKGSAVSTIRSVDRVDVAVQRLRELSIGALVVMDRWGKFVGMISERHIVRGLERYGVKVLSSRVDEIMSQDVVTCAPEDRVDRVMALMTVHRVRHLPVVEQDRIIGIVSIGDLVKRQLETKEQEARVLRDMAAAHV
jgi:CBS domain-containing protein